MRVRAAPTKPGRARTARWPGSGERDGEEYERNQRLRLSTPRRLKTVQIWAGCGASSNRVTGAGNSLAGFDMPVVASPDDT